LSFFFFFPFPFGLLFLLPLALLSTSLQDAMSQLEMGQGFNIQLLPLALGFLGVDWKEKREIPM